MAVPGREPNPNAAQPRSTIEWTEVENVPFKGKRPALPKTRTITLDDDVIQKPMDPLTIAWWAVISTMPHAALWTAADWLLAQSTAIVHDIFVCGTHTVAAELRRREQELGTTAEARRKLRIRYIEPEKPAPKPRASRAKKPAGNPVVQIDERRTKALTKTS